MSIHNTQLQQTNTLGFKFPRVSHGQVTTAPAYFWEFVAVNLRLNGFKGVSGVNIALQ